MIRFLVYGLSPNLGGTEKYILTLYDLLDKNKVQFDFLFSHDVGSLPYEQIIIKSGGMIYREYFMLKEKKDKRYISEKELFERHSEWHGVYINSQNIDSSYRLLIEAAKRRLPYRIIHAHSSGSPESFTLKKAMFQIWFFLTKRKVVTNYLACSELASRWLYHNKNALIIPNSVDFKMFLRNNFKRHEMRKQYSISDDEVIMGYCGGLRSEKNPQFLIKVFAELCKLIPKVRLLIVGGGDLELICRDLSWDLKVADKTIFVGEVDNVPDYMQMMDCFVLPSKYEGFGIALLEAQAAGIMCYTTKDVVPSEVNITGRVTFIPSSYTPKEWAEKILNGGFEWKDCTEKLMNSDYTLDKMRSKFNSVIKL